MLSRIGCVERSWGGYGSPLDPVWATTSFAAEGSGTGSWDWAFLQGGDFSPGELYMGVNKTRHEEGQKMVFPAKQCSEEIINIPVIPEAAA